MANIKSAKKRVKQTEKRRQVNIARKNDMKTAIKKIMTAISNNESAETIKEHMRVAESKLARAKGKGLIHANNAARKVSRLAKRVSQAVRG